MRYVTTFGLVSQTLMVHRADCPHLRKARIGRTFEAEHIGQALEYGLRLIADAPSDLFYLGEGMRREDWCRCCKDCKHREAGRSR